MKKHYSTRKRSFRQKHLNKSRKSKKSTRKSVKTKRNFRKNKKYNTKRIFFNNKKYRGGNHAVNTNGQYPNVYGIDNKAVLYPVSKYGVPTGLPEPPIQSNGPNGNGYYTGGKRRFKRHYGGGNMSTLLPQPLVNMGRMASGKIYETINGINGNVNPAYLDPMPYDQPIDK